MCSAWLVVYASLLVPGIILFDRFWSFLGLGRARAMTELGRAFARGRANHAGGAVAAFGAQRVLVATLFCFNFIGDGLRDARSTREYR